MSLLLLLPTGGSGSPTPTPENVPAPDIPTEALTTAVERYLPRTLNYAQDALLGEKDRDAVFARITQVLLAALLRDPSAVYYLVYLNAQRYLAAIDAAIATTSALSGDQYLQLAEAQAAVSMRDTGKLTDASIELFRMSSRIAGGQAFGANLVTQFETAVTTYLTEQVKPNVSTKNKAVVRSELKALMATLSTQWATVLARRDQIYNILVEYEAADIASIASSSVISALQERIATIEATLATESVEVTATQAADIFVDLAAGVAVLKTIGQVGSHVGVATGSASDGTTGTEYKVEEGTATTEPIRTILRGSAGKPLTPVISQGTNGRSYNDGDGDSTSYQFGSAGADFPADGVLAGHFLLFVDTGRVHRIETVNYSSNVERLKLSPEIDIATESARFIITERKPGSLFYDADVSMWTAYYGGGATGSTLIDSGSVADIAYATKATGSDGSNVRASGTASGNMYLTVDSGGSGSGTIATDIWSDGTATFVTSGVEPGDVLDIASGTEIVVVASVISETQIALATNLAATYGPSAAWVVRTPSDVIQDSTATFLADGVQVGDLVRGQAYLDTPGAVVLAVLSETRVQIDYDTLTTTRTSIDYEIRFQSDEFYTAGGNLLSNNVEAGDTLEFTAGGYTFTIDAVDDQEVLSVPSAWTINPSPGFDALAWEIYDVNTLGRQVITNEVGVPPDFTNANNVTAGRFGDGTTDPPVGPILEYPAGSGKQRTVFVRLDPAGSPTDHDIAYLDVTSPATSFWLLEATSPVASADWELYAGELTPILTDTVNSPFGSSQVGDQVVYKFGTADEVRTSITEVVSASEVRVDPELPAGGSAADIALLTSVKAGHELVAANRRVSVVGVVDEHTLLVEPALPTSLGINVEWQVISRGTDPRTSRLTRSAGAWLPSSVGQKLDIFADTQVQGTIIATEDLNGDGSSEVAVIRANLPIGRRTVSWRLRSQAIATSNEITATVDPDVISDGDTLTVWGYDGTCEVTAYSTSPDTITFTPALPSAQTGLDLVAHTGGSVEWGRYYLLNGKDAAVVLDDSVDTLELRVAEVLADFGSTLTSVVASTTPTAMSVSVDGITITDTTATFISDGVRVGDRIRLISGAVRSTRYILSRTETTLLIGQAVESGVVTTYQIDRNSISFAIAEAERLREDLAALREVVGAYTVPLNTTVVGILDMLRDQGMTRARELLLDGKITEFVAMNANDSSYAGAAKAALQAVGGQIGATQDVKSSAFGVDATTGLPVLTRKYAQTSAMASPEQEVDTIIAIAKVSQRLAGDEKVQAALAISMDEVRNRAIYELTGEVETDVVDDQDDTLPWLSRIGSKKDRTLQDKEMALAALDYILSNADNFEEVEES